MLTVKLVVLGSSGVGKTSLRGKYLSGRFSSGYRATIGTDFIAKTIPHPSRNGEFVALQIWDTAGQERFSGLSSAFYRGADAVLLMFDVNRPESLTSLTKWWSEFCQRAPVPDEEMENYCCVLVGNKIDLVGPDLSHPTPLVSEEEAHRFLEDLVPRSTSPPTLLVEEASPTLEVDAEEYANYTPQRGDDDFSFAISRSRCIDIDQPRGRNVSKSHSRNRLNGTVSSAHTGITLYHTPSSSLFDVYASARSSPAPPPSSRQSSPGRDRIPRRMTSLSSTSSSTATITPSLFTRARAESATPPTPPLPSVGSDHLPPQPDRRPKLFFTSAKTGEGVSDVFEYITRRVVMRWDYEEAIEAVSLHPQDTMLPTGETITLSRGEAQWPSGPCCGQ